MGRPLRQHLPARYVRVVQKCHNGSPLLDREEDRTLYLGLLARTVERMEYRLIDFCIQDTGIELLLHTPPGVEDRSVSSFMHRLNTAFSRRYNRLRQRTGTFWNSRPDIRWLPPEETARLEEELAATGQDLPLPPEEWPWCGAHWVLAGRMCPWPLDLARELRNCRDGPAGEEPGERLRRLRREHATRGRTAAAAAWQQQLAAKLRRAAAAGRIPRSLSWKEMVECHARILMS